MGDALIALAEQGTLSLSAVRLLDAAIGSGRNLLFTGPQEACLPLMAALVAEGERPGIYSASAHAGQADPSLAPDRMAAWGLPAHNAAQALLQQVGVVAHLPAGRLDRLLMRLELALAAPPAQGPMSVLAALDVVVVMAPSPHGGPRVTEVYEVVMAEDGYRPWALFMSGLQPLPEALVPQRVPSFAQDLVALGHGLLVAELIAACPRHPVGDGQAGASHNSPGSSAGAPLGPVPAPAHAASWEPAPRARAPRAAPTSRPAQPSPRPQSSPGWELDRAEPADAADSAARSGDGAAFAAVLEGAQSATPVWAPLADSDTQPDTEDTFLGPPPKPGHK